MNSSSIHPLSPSQERKIVQYLDEKLLDLTRQYKKRSEPSSTLQTLSEYLEAAQNILSLILQIPPIDPSTSLRTALLLRFTGEVFLSIPGYPVRDSEMQELLEWLDDLDQAWLAVLRVQVWRPDSSGQEQMDSEDEDEERHGAGQGVDLVVDADDVARGMKSSPLSQTERTRLKSLIIGGISSLEEWVAEEKPEVVAEEDVVGLQQGFDELFALTLEELGPSP
ncbi:hypothetical protein C8J56DRAFT_1007175 [Mycena floridula]|nr:hypothetical protein C8J56DRAFT_1007175 [Mycena floridula]